jgi:hypothetical protein
VAEDDNDDRAREEKAEAIRREILELKAQNHADGSSKSDQVEIQSPVESKVKPLKIPMKPKMVEGGKPAQQPRDRFYKNSVLAEKF